MLTCHQSLTICQVNMTHESGNKIMSEAKKAQLYLYFAHAGGLLLIALGAAYGLGAPDFLQGFIVGMLLVLVLVLFRSKMRDEYIERLWNAGTATAFVVVLCLTLLADLVRGFADPAVDFPTGAPGMPALQIGLAALAAFYIGFHIAMVKERS